MERDSEGDVAIAGFDGSAATFYIEVVGPTSVQTACEETVWPILDVPKVLSKDVFIEIALGAPCERTLLATGDARWAQTHDCDEDGAGGAAPGAGANGGTENAGGSRTTLGSADDGGCASSGRPQGGALDVAFIMGVCAAAVRLRRR